MRALGIPRFGGPDVLGVVERPLPEPGPGEIRVRVAAAAVNPSDLALRSGFFAPFLGELPPPYTPGMDAAGTVDSVGPGSRFARGDRVLAFVNPLTPNGGAQAEYVVVPQDQAAEVPPALELEDAAGLPMNGLTAHQALALLDLPGGATLAVSGATGALGGLLVQLACYRGLRVIAGAHPQDHELIRSLGAGPVARDLDAYLEAVPEGVDAFVDAAGIGAEAARVVKHGGDYVQCGAAPVTLPADRELVHHRLNVLAHPGKAAALTQLAALAAKGILTPRTASRLAPDGAAQAHRRLEAGGLRGRQLLVF
ncbi:NADP-dependent oxidoreductase [Streptomyces sp. NPDC059917]|uniref:NADP-dependent oxidoreductase n=1 Tax=Streptomyces sp. NPDC059917 TaxID=3347002 RepID=UPI00365B1A59